MKKSIGMDSETYDKVSKIAKRNNRSLIDQIRFWIKMEVKK